MGIMVAGDSTGRPAGRRSKLLECLFRPSSVAVIGASEKPGKVGTVVLGNILKSGYTGKIFPVNPSHEEVMGLPCHPSVSELPETPDLAIIIVPAPAVQRA